MKKFKNIIFVMIFICISIGIVIFNYKMDPYNIEELVRKNQFIDLFHAPRDLVYVLLDESKKNQYDYVVISGSSGNVRLPFQFLIPNLKKTFARLSFAGVSPKEQYELLKRYLELHPETKKAFISLEFGTYLTCSSPNSILEEAKNSSKLKTFFKLYYSYDTLLKSVNKLKNQDKNKKNLKNKKISKNDYYEVYIKRKYNYPEICEYQNIEYLKKIKELIDSKNINAVYIIPPVHMLYYANQYYDNTYERTENLKRMYAQITPYYDMGFMHPHSFLPMKEYILFQDVIHASKFLCLEKKEIMENKTSSQEILVYVDKNNVEDILKQQKQQLIKYIEENKDEVNEYANKIYNERIDGEYKEKIYYTEEFKRKYPKSFNNK